LPRAGAAGRRAAPPADARTGRGRRPPRRAAGGEGRAPAGRVPRAAVRSRARPGSAPAPPASRPPPATPPPAPAPPARRAPAAEDASAARGESRRRRGIRVAGRAPVAAPPAASSRSCPRRPLPGRSAGAVVFLERAHGEWPAAQQLDAFGGGGGRGQRREVRDATLERGAAEGKRVAVRLGADRRVDDERDLPRAEGVDDVRLPLLHLVDRLDGEATCPEPRRRATRGEERE